MPTVLDADRHNCPRRAAHRILFDRGDCGTQLRTQTAVGMRGVRLATAPRHVWRASPAQPMDATADGDAQVLPDNRHGTIRRLPVRPPQRSRKPGAPPQRRGEACTSLHKRREIADVSNGVAAVRKMTGTGRRPRCAIQPHAGDWKTLHMCSGSTICSPQSQQMACPQIRPAPPRRRSSAFSRAAQDRHQ